MTFASSNGYDTLIVRVAIILTIYHNTHNINYLCTHQLGTSLRKGWCRHCRAVARRSGWNSSMGVRKAENSLASSTLQSYLSTWVRVRVRRTPVLRA